MKYRLSAAFILLAFTSQLAQAMPVPRVEIESGATLVRDGCPRDFHPGPDGYCHRDGRDWNRDRGPPPPPGFFGGPRYEEGPRYYNDGPRYRQVCPRGYHLGHRSGVCRPNDDL